MFTHLLRDDDGRARLRRFFRTCLPSSASLWWAAAAAGNPGPDVDHAALALAVADGLVIQQLIGQLADYEDVIDTFASLVTPALMGVLDEGAGVASIR